MGATNSQEEIDPAEDLDGYQAQEREKLKKLQKMHLSKQSQRMKLPDEYKSADERRMGRTHDYKKNKNKLHDTDSSYDDEIDELVKETEGNENENNAQRQGMPLSGAQHGDDFKPENVYEDLRSAGNEDYEQRKLLANDSVQPGKYGKIFADQDDSVAHTDNASLVGGSMRPGLQDDSSVALMDKKSSSVPTRGGKKAKMDNKPEFESTEPEGRHMRTPMDPQ